MAKLKYVVDMQIQGFGSIAIKEGSATFTPSGVSREEVMGEKAETSGYTEKPVVAKLEIDANVFAETDVQSYGNINNHNITITHSDGTSDIMYGAYLKDPMPLAKGTGKLVFQSNISKKLS